MYKLRLKTAVLIDFALIKWYNKYYYVGKPQYDIPMIKILTKRIDFRDISEVFYYCLRRKCRRFLFLSGGCNMRLKSLIKTIFIIAVLGFGVYFAINKLITASDDSTEKANSSASELVDSIENY